MRFEGKRFANYHGQTYFDEIEVLSIVDVAARMNAVMAGEVDFVDRADLKTLPMLASNPEVTVSEIAGFAHYTAPMNCTVAPFNDRNVRLALKYAIDRKELVDKILLGHGTAGNDNPIAKGVPFHADPKAQHAYDPDKVKFYLKSRGTGDIEGRSFDRRCGLCGSRRRGASDEGVGRQGRHRHQCRPRAE